MYIHIHIYNSNSFYFPPRSSAVRYAWGLRLHDAVCVRIYMYQFMHLHVFMYIHIHIYNSNSFSFPSRSSAVWYVGGLRLYDAAAGGRIHRAGRPCFCRGQVSMWSSGKHVVRQSRADCKRGYLGPRRVGRLLRAGRSCLCEGQVTESSSDSASHTHTPTTVCWSWGPIYMWMFVLSSALICNALARKCSRRRSKHVERQSSCGLQVGLYTILPSPILYGVWHKGGGSVGGRILRNGRAIG